MQKLQYMMFLNMSSNNSNPIDYDKILTCEFNTSVSGTDLNAC